MYWLSKKVVILDVLRNLSWTRNKEVNARNLFNRGIMHLFTCIEGSWFNALVPRTSALHLSLLIYLVEDFVLKIKGVLLLEIWNIIMMSSFVFLKLNFESLLSLISSFCSLSGMFIYVVIRYFLVRLREPEWLSVLEKQALKPQTWGLCNKHSCSSQSLSYSVTSLHAHALWPWLAFSP